MVRQAIEQVSGGGSLARWAMEPIAWTGAALVVGLATLRALLPAPIGIMLLAAGVGTAASLAAWRRTRERAPVDPRIIAFGLTEDGVWDYDLQTSSISYDERCARMLGYEAGAVASHLGAWGKLVHPEDLPRVRAALDAFIAGTSGGYQVHVRLRGADGRWRTILDRATVAQRDEQGRPTRLIGVHRLVAEGPERIPTPVPAARRGGGETMLQIMQRLVSQREVPRVRIDIRYSDDLGEARVDEVALAGVSRVLDAIAEQVPDSAVITARPKAPRDTLMVGFTLGLPSGTRAASARLEEAEALLRSAGGRLRVRADQIAIELPAAQPCRPPGAGQGR